MIRSAGFLTRSKLQNVRFPLQFRNAPESPVIAASGDTRAPDRS